MVSLCNGNHDDKVSVQKLTGYMGATYMMRYQYSNLLVTWGNHDDKVSVQKLTGYMGVFRSLIISSYLAYF
jgi:succinate-acetate transporter protein